MTARRRLLVFGLLATLTGLGVGGWLLWPRTAITRENAARIQNATTMADVEAILGGPARDERTGQTEPDTKDDLESMLVELELLVWDTRLTSVYESDEVKVFLALDSQGGVKEWCFLPMRRVRENPLEMLRRRLHL
jgi:hypothetical protein